jgi:hypothetical protein
MVSFRSASTAFEGLFAFAIAGVTSSVVHAGVFGVTQVPGHIDFQSTLDKAFGQLLESAVLANKVFRFFVAILTSFAVQPGGA